MVGEVISIGRVNVDVDMRLKQFPKENDHMISERGQIFFGGSASNFAAQCTRLGIKTTLVSCIGNDDYGQLALKNLTKIGVDTSCILTLDNQRTGIFVIAHDEQGKRMIIVEPGANQFLDRRIFEEETVTEAHLIHVAGAFPMMIDRALEMCRINGMILSLDPGRAAKNLDYDRILRNTDLLFVNQFELEDYFGIQAKKSELMSFAKTFPGVLILKRGKSGATATDGFEYFTSKIFEVDVADTMGAGDAFAAGFVTGWMRTDRIQPALNLANAVAALTITQYGAQNGQPNLDEAARLLRDYNVSIDAILKTFKKPQRPKKKRRGN